MVVMAVVLACWWKAESKDAIIEQIGEMMRFLIQSPMNSTTLSTLIQHNRVRPRNGSAENGISISPQRGEGRR